MRRTRSVSWFAALIVLILVGRSLGAMFVQPLLDNVPIDRLIVNMEKLSRDTPADVALRLNIARAHAMAYAYKTNTAQIRRGDEKQGVWQVTTPATRNSPSRRRRMRQPNTSRAGIWTRRSPAIGRSSRSRRPGRRPNPDFPRGSISSRSSDWGGVWRRQASVMPRPRNCGRSSRSPHRWKIARECSSCRDSAR